jgi:hypothetical protein
MEANTDSISILTKQVLKSEIEVLRSRLKLQETGELYTAISVMEKRIAELEGDNS